MGKLDKLASLGHMEEINKYIEEFNASVKCQNCNGEAGWVKDYEGNEYYQCENCDWDDKPERED